MTNIDKHKRVIVALDFSKRADCMSLVDQLDPQLCRVKIGKELFTRFGPELVKDVVGLGFDVFLDLKFHDIPNTVAGAVAAAEDLGVWMVNVHASGGRIMMEAARQRLSSPDAPLLIAVTVLTSMAKEDLLELGVERDPAQQVLALAQLTVDCNLDGVVCSAQETQQLRLDLPADFCLVTPGIRPVEDVAGDQKRIATPASAIAMGSDFLVIGRPITQSPNPLQKLIKICQDIGSI